MIKKITLAGLAMFFTFCLVAQVQVDKAIQLTGTGTDAKVEGVDAVANNHDAANKIYVDTAIANRSPGTRYFIGDYYGGGVIVYVDSTTQHGYIAAKTLQSTGTSWSNVGNTAVGASAQSFTNGASNTTAIIGQSGHTSSAALICDNYAGGGFTDWYLPSAGELGGACRMQGLFFSLSFYSNAANSLFWSSTENPSNPGSRAVGVSFTDCQQQLVDDYYGMQKFQSYKVWCVRKF